MGVQQARSDLYWLSIVNSLDQELIIVDRKLRIVQANAAVLQRYGRQTFEVIGKPCHQLTHEASQPCQLPLCECPIPKALTTGAPARTVHIHPNDAQGAIYTEVTASPLKDGSGNITEFVLLIRDITKAKKLEQQATLAKQRLLSLNDIAYAVSQSLDLDTILNATLDKALALVRGNIGGILLLDERSKTLSYRVQRGLSEEFIRGTAKIGLGEGIAGEAALLGKTIYVPDISKDTRITRSVVSREGLRSFVSIPLLARDKVLGVMNIATRNRSSFRPEDITLVSSLGNQVSIAIENAMLYNEIQEKERSRGELLHRIISIQEEERKRIARGLHDEISQSLTGLAFNLEAISEALPTGANGVASKLKAAQSLTMKMLDEVHSVVYELRPTLLDDLGLLSAVQWLADNHLREAGIQVLFETVGDERTHEPQIETALFRIAQEAITNILRHANAESVTISFEFRATSVAFRVEDDGQGFAPEDITISAGNKRGLGLLGMKERAELLGGTLAVESHPGCGTKIDVEIPV